MPLPLETEWTLAACGLVALADGVFNGGEAGRVLDMVHSLVPLAEQDAWIDDITSRESMQARLDVLAAPPPDSPERILRRAWSIALVDGEGSPDEARVLEQVGERLGRPRDEVTTWRKLWTSHAVETAGHVAGFAALLMRRRAAASPIPGDLPGPDDRDAYHRLLARLPLSEARRSRLVKLLDEPGSVEDLGHALLWLGPERRDEVLREIAAYIRTAGAGPLGRQLFLALAARMAVREDLAARYLDP
jgi:tellurite resistance protein